MDDKAAIGGAVRAAAPEDSTLERRAVQRQTYEGDADQSDKIVARFLEKLRSPLAPKHDAGEVAWEESNNVRPLPPHNPRWRGAAIGFALVVVLPTFLLALYLALWASPQYSAEFRFSVTEVSSAGQSAPPPSSSAPPSMLNALVGGNTPNASPNNQMVIDYLTSRQAVDDLMNYVNLAEIYSRSNADWWFRYSGGQSREALVAYWSKMITARYDRVTGLARVEVWAFTPEDAFRISNALVELSENLVNGVAGRARRDTVRFAEWAVSRAQEQLDKARAELAEFRAREGVIDPSTGMVSSNTQLVATLRATLSELRTSMDTMRRQSINDDSPQMQALMSRIRATEEQLKLIEREINSDRAGRESLAKLVALFEKLEVNRQYAQAQMLSALQNLDLARVNAATQHLYLTPYVRPAVPTSAGAPQTFRSLTLTAIGLLGLWLVGLLVIRSVRSSAA